MHQVAAVDMHHFDMHHLDMHQLAAAAATVMLAILAIALQCRGCGGKKRSRMCAATPGGSNKGSRLAGWGSPIFAMAPMVGQSDRPFRMLCRKFGASVCWSEMLMADRFSSDAAYRMQALGRYGVHADDHPLVVQFAANNPRDFTAAARAAEAMGADAVDLNLGCPQRRAKQVSLYAFVHGHLFGDTLSFTTICVFARPIVTVMSLKKNLHRHTMVHI